MSDRKQLIRIASELPKGDPSRRVLLAELQKQGSYGLLSKALVRNGLHSDWFDQIYEENGGSPQLDEDNPGPGPRKSGSWIGAPAFRWVETQ